MIKVTPNVNLVPCTRDRFVNGAPHNDLTFNFLQACKLIRIANHFFNLRPGAVYSGYIEENPQASFTLKLWHEETLLQTFVVSNLGYGGALHADISDRSGIHFEILRAATSDPSLRPDLAAA